MVWEINCECTERTAADINSIALFKEVNQFFEEQVKEGVYKDLSDYNCIWHEHGGFEKKIYRTTIKRYECEVCGCCWEFYYPEFPASGQVRKFPKGSFSGQEWE